MGLDIVDVNIILVFHENFIEFSLLLSLLLSLDLFLTYIILSIIIVLIIGEANESSNNNRDKINS